MSQSYALVTGTSSGIGLEMAKFLLEEGHIVFGVSRRGSDIVHENFIDVIGDIQKEADVERVFEAVAKVTDGLHLVVNNAGICQMSPLEEMSTREFADHLNTNVLGAFHVLKHSYDFIIEGVTHFVTVSSEAAKKPYPNFSAYCASKAALTALINTCRVEWKELEVRFSTFFPGAVYTPLWENLDAVYKAEEMLQIEDFLDGFATVVNAPGHVEFQDLSFSHHLGAGSVG